MKIRMQITKDPEIRFVSHLDYLRAIERGIRRAELPVAYSEGFNPHMKFSLASALGVGVVSYAEFVEMEMREPMQVDDAVEKLRLALPRGIRIIDADATVSNDVALMTSAALCDYRITLPFIDQTIEQKVQNFNDSKSVIYQKRAIKRKEGFKEVDIKRFIDKLFVNVERGQTVFTFSVKIFDDGSLKAVDVLKALEIDVKCADVERLAIWRHDHKPMLQRKT